MSIWSRNMFLGKLLSSVYFTKQVVDFSRVGIDSTFFETNSHENSEIFGKSYMLTRNSISGQNQAEKVLLQLQVLPNIDQTSRKLRFYSSPQLTAR